jgi:hypothetical protein
MTRPSDWRTKFALYAKRLQEAIEAHDCYIVARGEKCRVLSVNWEMSGTNTVAVNPRGGTNMWACGGGDFYHLDGTRIE